MSESDHPLPRQTPARLEDIAARVGISRSEVSRVLNGRLREGRSVGRAKQEEIWRVARELNYQPNRSARSLARGRTDAVGLLLQIPPSRELPPHYQEIVGALTYTLHARGFNLLLVQSDDNPVAALERLVRARACDGIVLTDMEVQDPRPGLLEQLGQAFVIRGSAPRDGLLAVGTDNVAVGRMAVEAFAARGHRRILFHNIGRHLLAGERRRQGFRQGVAAQGLEATARYVDDIWLEEDLYALTLRVLAEPDPPTAFFAADETAACGVLRALAESGRAPGRDLGVLTCLNARFMRRVLPGLSVLNVRQHEVASAAGEALAQRLRGEAVEARQTFLAPVLEDHGSLGG